ncbi:hypothetical protein BpHYR1_012130 [Brachionus plicatilis]|uniref:Uncharacterized protein n=1 Tax=Brachionus plicatilis TaxID=10195 RepID=A0A3M7Q7G9_BRAPC|nr:hypothetical protein BpHYR1_012130 [Brachionus plicatilis]
MLRSFYRGLATQTSARERILDKLDAKFGTNLIAAKVNNLSWKHDEPRDSEKYLEVVVVATEFEGMLKSKLYQRNELVTKLLEEETSGCQVTYQVVGKKFIKTLLIVDVKLLTPSKWYDSNLRGLKLQEVYSDPPVCAGKLKELAEQFYSKLNSK